jgi:hypothetical protein
MPPLPPCYLRMYAHTYVRRLSCWRAGAGFAATYRPQWPVVLVSLRSHAPYSFCESNWTPGWDVVAVRRSMRKSCHIRGRGCVTGLFPHIPKLDALSSHLSPDTYVTCVPTCSLSKLKSQLIMLGQGGESPCQRGSLVGRAPPLRLGWRGYLLPAYMLCMCVCM